ncbi:hypothetical protein OIU85_002244 [Salix viminalis]|uniref:Transcription factor CBF/NF-Y/archaeal histone domain-containing protein n=1 Tax=Salix viminalis TaxID=40686 RepID=A0A9Q0VNC5_SALVM|nr:hypothetical protein OIU85_002244 [Salix viminalis]
MADSDNESGGGGQNPANTNELLSPREMDRFLPIANVSRIMKKALPANAKISKDAKETVQECVSEFISFITGEASDKCQREKRKTRFREAEGEKITVGRDRDAPSNGSGLGVEGFGGYVYGSGGFCFNQMGGGGPGDSLGRPG